MYDRIAYHRLLAHRGGSKGGNAKPGKYFIETRTWRPSIFVGAKSGRNCTCLKEINGDIRCVGKTALSDEGIEHTVGLISAETSPKIHQPPPGGTR